MAEIFDFEKARERRDSPENLKEGDVCYLKLKGNILSSDKVEVVSVNGKFAEVKLLVGFGVNIDGFVWLTLQGGEEISLNFAETKNIAISN